MKKINYILTAITCAFLLSSCVEDFNNGKGQFEEGIPTHVNLKFGVENSPVITRAAQESRYEYDVDNLYVLIFDKSGNLHYNGYFEEGTGLTVNLDPTEGRTSCTGTLGLETQTTMGATIVGIANIGDKVTAYRITKEQLDGIQNLDELKELIMYMSQESIERSSLYLMTGYAKDSEGNTSIDIISDASGTTNLDCTLELERTDAKVQFDIEAKVPDGKNWSDFTFSPGEWSVVNVPLQSYVLPRNGNADANGTYMNTTPRVFETFKRDASNILVGGGFVFYMPENKKAPEATIPDTGDKAKDYALREECEHKPGGDINKPGSDYTNGAFTYANANSTYVVFTGILSYKDNDNGGKEYSAEVRCTVHLGYGSGDANDYRTERNTHYVYHVTINGIDDIIIEVTSDQDQENRPGYEGDVISSTAEVFELDSHYGRAHIKLNKSIITDQTTWAIRTPFSNGVYSGNGDFKGVEDYKWIKFAINREYGVADKKYVKYPGDQNYKGGQNQTSPSYEGFPNARLLDIQQLIEHLREVKDNDVNNIFDDNGDVYITAFVDENIYVTDPTDESATQDLLLWKKTADTQDRLLHILSGDPSYSSDGNSSLVNSIYTFRQRSIRTIFNVDKPELKTGWGLESFSETDRLVPLSSNASNISSNSADNGRTNTWGWMQGLKWTQIISVDALSDKELLGNYQSAAYACMLRNRDLNGDNNIDQNEVRWYLASINQLTEIFIGEYALDDRSRLYPQNAADRPGAIEGTYWHYTSSTMSSRNDTKVIWAEEGASIGPRSASEEKNGQLYSYRCIRNLGIALDDIQAIPEKLVKYEKITSGENNGGYIVDMTNLNEKSRRTAYTSTSLPLHHERSGNNLTYAKFEVKAGAEENDLNANGKKPESGAKNTGWFEYEITFPNSSAWNEFQEVNPCPAGYRVPNHRELLVMATSLPDETWVTYTSRTGGIPTTVSGKPTYMCITAFSMYNKYPYNDPSKPREGFMYHANNGNFSLQNSRDEKGYVRCVKDVM